MSSTWFREGSVTWGLQDQSYLCLAFGLWYPDRCRLPRISMTKEHETTTICEEMQNHDAASICKAASKWWIWNKEQEFHHEHVYQIQYLLAAHSGKDVHTYELHVVGLLFLRYPWSSPEHPFNSTNGKIGRESLVLGQNYLRALCRQKWRESPLLSLGRNLKALQSYVHVNVWYRKHR